MSTCSIRGHTNRPLKYICTNSTCSSSRLICFQCLTSVHEKCVGTILEIDDIMKAELLSNINWVKSPDLKQAILLMEEYNLTDKDDQLFELVKETVTAEFTKLTEHMISVLQEVKEKVIRRLRELNLGSEVNLKEFHERLRSMYNFDSLLGIIESWQRKEQDTEVINAELNMFFKDVYGQHQKEKELKAIAKRLQTFIKSYVEFDRQPFENFKKSIQLKTLEQFPHYNPSWTWNPAQKSNSIILSRNNMIVTKASRLTSGSAVLGNVVMSKGRYRWEIKPKYEYWICFGIAEFHLASNFEDFSYRDAIAFSPSGERYNMTNVETLPNHNDKRYLCDLDFNKGTFTISCQGTMLCKQNYSIQGKVLVPFMLLYKDGNTAKLKIVD